MKTFLNQLSGSFAALAGVATVEGIWMMAVPLLALSILSGVTALKAGRAAI